MAGIRSKNTAPELRVRRALHRAGARFRIHGTRMPGRPDVVMRGPKICVFVHGCFWHGCRRCIDGRRKVQSNRKYWSDKVRTNRRRDARHLHNLRREGWRVFDLGVSGCEAEQTRPARRAGHGRSCGAVSPQRSQTTVGLLPFAALHAYRHPSTAGLDAPLPIAYASSGGTALPICLSCCHSLPTKTNPS